MPERLDPRPSWLDRSADAIKAVHQSHKAIRFDDARRLFEALALIESDDLPTPAIVTTDGRIAAVWNHGDRALRIEAEAGEVRAIRYAVGRPVVGPANPARSFPELLRNHALRVFGRAVNANSESQMHAEAIKEGRRT